MNKLERSRIKTQKNPQGQTAAGKPKSNPPDSYIIMKNIKILSFESQIDIINIGKRIFLKTTPGAQTLTSETI
jgi:hypothetical protein